MVRQYIDFSPQFCIALPESPQQFGDFTSKNKKIKILNPCEQMTYGNRAPELSPDVEGLGVSTVEGQEFGVSPQRPKRKRQATMDSIRNGSERYPTSSFGERSNGNQNGVHNSNRQTWKLDTKKLVEILIGRPATVAALEHLANAKETALQCGQLPEAFGVDLSELQLRGLAGYELKILNDQNLVRKCHVQSSMTSQNSSAERPNQLLNWGYVITSFGEMILKSLLAFSQESNPHGDSYRSKADRSPRAHENGAKVSADVPHYNSKTRTLTCHGAVARKFRWAASNQEKILLAFQEEGWPTRIDDPLPSDTEICPKRRLHDTIKCLNQGQRSKGTWYVRFRGDGTGQGVLWEFNDDSNSVASTA